MIVTRVQEQDNNSNGYLVWLFQVVSRLNWFIKWYSQVVSRSTYKWYITSGAHEDSKFKNWSKLTNPTSGSMVANSFKWYHISTCGINHTRWWFHKWSSTLSDHQDESSLTYKCSRLSSEWPMLWHRGRCPTNWYQGQRSFMIDLKTIVVSFQYM